MKKNAFILLMFFAWSQLGAQSFYDLTTVQEIHIYFGFSDWDYRLDTAKAGTESYIEADSVIVNDKKFKKVGVKYKGNSSYDAARIKNPLHIKLDYDGNNDYQGYEEIKLGNGWSDNSMIREPLCYSILQQYMDAPRGNFARVYINGVFYGFMNNAEDVGTGFLSDHFYSSKYAFVKCNPLSIGTGLGNGPNLAYLGTAVDQYSSKYELKSDTGWSELIHLCDTLNNHFDAFAQIADVDRFLWMLAFNNVLVNLDSYSGAFRQNYYVYRDHNGRWIPVIWDLNMCMGGFPNAGGISGALTPTSMATMNYTLHKTEQGWPLLYKLLNDPFYQKMYFAHMRTINQEQFLNGSYKTLATQLHTLVDADVATDPNYLSSYANFQVSLTTDTPGDNGAGASPGIFKLMDARAAYLNNVLSAAPPVIANPSVQNGDQFGAVATITATATNATAVYLGYRFDRSDAFVRIPMYDDGAHGDGAAGDQVYGAECPVLSASVQYYFYAENANTGAFLPQRAEHEFLSFEPLIAAAAPGEVVLNEFTTSNDDGIETEKGKYKDWLELYNTTGKALSLDHLFLSNSPGDQGEWQFPAGAFIAPYQHLLVWADEADKHWLEYHTNFSLSKSGDELIFGDTITVFDSLSFGAQIPNHSMSRCPDGTGAFKDSSTRTPREANTCTSGVSGAPEQPIVRVMPNPASNVVRVETEEPLASVTVYDAAGRLINRYGSGLIDSSNWAPGLYWLHVIVESGQWITVAVVRE